MQFTNLIDPCSHHYKFSVCWGQLETDSLDFVVVHKDNSMESIPSSECISRAVGQEMCHFFWGHTL
jgi:hypothetical protein